MRSLGHELNGTLIKRTVVGKRIGVLKLRLKRVKSVGQTAGSRITRSWPIGIFAIRWTWSHG